MSLPLVSFCLQAYNQREYIDAALDGAFAQTYRPLEIVISDDHSTDGTGYRASLARIHRTEIAALPTSSSPATHPDTWCRYLVALLETHHTARFNRVLARYLQRGGTPASLARYLRLSQLETLNSKLETINSKLATSLNARHAARPFARLVEGRTVALVGNGPQEVGKGSGREIDAHDLVIRINNYDIASRASDYGTRTDIWSKNLTPEQRHELPDPRIRLVIYSEDLLRDPLDDDYRAHLARDLDDPRLAVDYIDHDEKAFVTRALHAYPTAGASLLAKLRTCHPASVDVYGFSLLQSPTEPADYSRLPKDVPPALQQTRVAYHTFPKEVAFLRTHFQGRRFLP